MTVEGKTVIIMLYIELKRFCVPLLGVPNKLPLCFFTLSTRNFNMRHDCAKLSSPFPLL